MAKQFYRTFFQLLVMKNCRLEEYYLQCLFHSCIFYTEVITVREVAISKLKVMILV